MKKLIFTTLALFILLATKAQDIKYSSTIEVFPGDTRATILAKAAHVVPTPNQLRALKEEFIAFIHLGPNTFTQKEWGNGFEDPSIFALENLDTDQWCKAMRDAGIRMVLLTAKHHDGFVLWQSRYTKHGVMSTGFRDGRGDVVKDLSASCRKYGLKLGVYLSPADLYQIESPDGLYGNLSKPSVRTIPTPVQGRPYANKTEFQFNVDDYNEYFLNQLFELLTEYGPVHEVWFDGAHPKTKGGQTYNYAAWKELIHTLAPKAVIFGREDIRWCGNEAGATRNTEWNVIPYAQNPNTMTHFPDMTADNLGGIDTLMNAKFLHYQQAETNTSIREGWFYRDDTHQGVRSADDVFDIYERSVGGNSTFLLNIPPNREGRFSSADVDVLREVGKRIRETYDTNLFKGAVRKNLPGNVIVITNKRPVAINRVVLQEAISTHGERVAQHAVDVWIDGAWHEVAAATNIGYKRILRFPEVTTDRLRLRILDSRLTPEMASIATHYYRSRPPRLTIARNAMGKVTITPAVDDFNWKSHGENAAQNLSSGLKIYYTTDGTTPDSTNGDLYTEPFEVDRGEVQAIAITAVECGSTTVQVLGYDKREWRTTTLQGAIMIDTLQGATMIDFGRDNTLAGLIYAPIGGKSKQMRVNGTLETSTDGIIWRLFSEFEIDNLVNDPSARRVHFKTPVATRFLRITPDLGQVITIDNLELY